jgi:adenylate kinase
MTDLNLIVLGPPGAGKSTQAARLRDDLGLTYLSTGDILRRHYAAGAALGRRATCYMEEGQLVPEEFVISMLLDELEAVGLGGFLLDGFPARPRRHMPWIARLRRRAAVDRRPAA